MERTPFCIVRKPVRTLRLRSVRFTPWRARLAADFVLAIADTLVGSGLTVVRGGLQQGLDAYMRLPNASFAFCLSAASAPPIRICSTVRLPATGVASV